MNITLNGTKITQDTRNLAFEKNNNVDEIVVTVDTDESWSYKLDVKYPDKYNVENDALYNIIDLDRNGIICSVILTREMLPFNGKYTMQLRGINGDKVYHSDTFEVWVKYSIEPGSTYNPVPSEFYQVEARLDDKVNEAKKYAENAEIASTRMPKISPDNTWLIWDAETGDYVDTGIVASGGGSGTNDHSLTFTGAVTGSYDGSAPLTVDIPAIDSTLTVEGKAADAKAVGDALSALSEEKVSLPKAEDGTAIPGTAGWYAVSDGAGGITWVEFAPSTGGGGETTTHGIVWDLVNVTSSNNAVSVADGASLGAVLTPADGYTLGDVTITIGGEFVTGAWNADTATVTIQSVTGDVVISCAGVEQTGPADTSPVIEQSGYALGPSSSPVAKDWACYTVAYPVDGSVDLTLKYHLPNYDGVSISQYGKIHAFVSGEYATYYTLSYATSSSDGESSSKTEIRYGTYDALKFTLVEAYKDDSYLYIDGTGEIIFAGKNTKYYGMANIDGTPAGGGSGGTGTASIAAEVDNAVMMLAMTTGETAVASDYSSLTEEYVAMVQANYDAMMAECLGDFNKIPLIIHTDQHGKMSNATGADILKLIGTITNWYEIGKCINLGDICGNTFTSSTLQSYLDNAADYIPLSKRVEVYGNHDIWDSDDSQKYTVSQKRLSPYFKNIYARRHGNNGYFTIPDDYFNVKYLVINNMEYPDTNYGQTRMTTAQANFLVSELSANDGYDIIILSHIPFTASGLTSRDPDYYDFSENFLYDTTANASLQTMLSARKNHSSGTFTDSEGVEHAYDFSNVSGKLLMSLHGHEHWEGYTTLENSITEFVFASVNASSELENRTECTTFYFGYIDRENMKFKCWRNESGYDALEISIA